MAHWVGNVTELSQVGEARRVAQRLAAEAGFNEVDIGRVALIATELGTNLVKHAKHGRLLLGLAKAPGGQRASVELLSIDQGPGMADVARCLRDGYSTTGTQGSGLGAVKRLSDRFSVYSRLGEGTVAAARVGTAPLDNPVFDVGAVAIAAPGETACGDGWAFHLRSEQRAALIVSDGLGHGPMAEEASLAALDVFDRERSATPTQVLERAHQQLRSTRGAAVAVAELDAERGELLFSGAGNIAGRVVSGVDERSLLSQHGTVGLQVRSLHDMRYAWPAHALLVLHSDGITTRWSFAQAEGLLQCDPVVIAAWLIRGHCRGRDDATVVVVRRH